MAKEQKAVLRGMASALDEFLNGKGPNKPNGFVLLVFPMERAQGGLQQVNYISNCQRREVVEALEEIVQRFKEGAIDG